MGVRLRRAWLVCALVAIFALGTTPLGASAASPGPTPPASAGAGTYLPPQDGTPASVYSTGVRATSPSRPTSAAPHHVQAKKSTGRAGAAARVVSVTPRPAPRSAATRAMAPAPGFGATNSITRGDEVNFNGLDVAPPDTQIAVGESYSIEIVNDMGSISARGGVQQFFDLNVRATAWCPGAFQQEYRYWWKLGATGRWNLMSGYTLSTNEAMWDIRGHGHGTYYFEVDIRNYGTSVSYETTAVVAYQL